MLDHSIPNIEALDDTDLEQFAKDSIAVATLAHYVKQARTFRLKGDIVGAKKAEYLAEQLYTNLPSELKY